MNIKYEYIQKVSRQGCIILRAHLTENQDYAWKKEM